ncbi:MAG: hypothetical protein LUF90_09470 [Rikenellaceae bacterium]|nr:hypothetical protein [Rikenellaceae bacterium]
MTRFYPKEFCKCSCIVFIINLPFLLTVSYNGRLWSSIHDIEKGSNIHLTVSMDIEIEARRIFEALSK